MQQSQKIMVLIEALLYIAHHQHTHPLGGKKLADILDISPRYLEPLLQILVREHILNSTRGPRGGYSFRKSYDDVTLSDVIIAFNTKECSERARTSPIFDAVITPVFSEARSIYIEALENITIADLCQRANNAGLTEILQNNTDSRLDYII